MFERSTSGPINQPRQRVAVALFRAVASLIIAGLLIAGALTSPGITQAFTLATTKQPERLTELYFNNSQHLPKQITAGKLSAFSFHVTNHEATDTIYRAQVFIVENGHVRPLETMNFVLADSTSRDITVPFTTTQLHTQLELIVQLPDQNEVISFRSQS